MTTGQKIKELRQAKNLSQKELGIMSGLSEPAIRNYELGNRTPSPQQLEKIAAALNVSVYAISDPEIEDYSVAGCHKGVGGCLVYCACSSCGHQCHF